MSSTFSHIKLNNVSICSIFNFTY